MPLDALAILGISTASSWIKEALSDLIADSFKDYAKDFLKDQIKSHIHLEGTPLHAAVAKAVAAFLAILEEQLRMARDFTFEGPGLSRAANLFVKDAEVRELLAGQFEDLSRPTLHPTRLMSVWQELNLPSVLNQNQWSAIQRPYFEAVTKLVRENEKLRPLLSADLASATLRATQLTAGLDPGFQLARYRKSILANFQFVKLSALSPEDGSFNIQLMDVFVPQRARRPLRYTDKRSSRTESATRQHGGYLPHLRGPGDLAEDLPIQDPARDVLQILGDAQIPRCVILGSAGSGKSSLARYLSLQWAEGKSDRTPFFIEIPRYLADGNEPKGFLDYLESGRSAIWHFAQRDVMEHLLHRDCVLILDALDEVHRDNQRRDLVQEIVRFAGEFPRTRIVVTSRTLSYLPENLEQAGFVHFELQDFDTGEIDRFLERWYSAMFSDQAQRTESIDRLKEDLTESEAIRSLAANPLLLTMLALLNLRQRLPDSRAEIYEKITQLLLEDWEKQKHSAAAPLAAEGIGLPEKTMILRLLAREMLQTPSELAANAVAQKDAESVIAGFLKSIEIDRPIPTARLLLDQLRVRDSVLASAGSAGFSFIHRSFLEYFGALDLKLRVEQEKSEQVSQVKTLFRAHFDDEFRREVLRLLASMLHWRLAHEVLTDLASVEDPGAILLAALCFSEHPNRARMPQLSRSLLDQVKDLTEFDVHYYRHDFAESIYARYPVWPQQPAFSIRGLAVTLLARVWSAEPGVIDYLKSLVESPDSSTAQVAIEELSRRSFDREAAFEYLITLTGIEQPLAIRMFAWQEITEKWKHIGSVPSLVRKAAKEDVAPEISAILLNFLLTTALRQPETKQFLRFCTRFPELIDLAQLAWDGVAKYWAEDEDTWSLIFAIAGSKREWPRVEAIRFLGLRYPDNKRLIGFFKHLAETELVGASSIDLEFSKALLQELKRLSSEDSAIQGLLGRLPDWVQDWPKGEDPNGDEPIPLTKEELRKIIEAAYTEGPVTERQSKALQRYAYNFADQPDVLPVVIGVAERTQDAHEKATVFQLLGELWIDDREVLDLILRAAESDPEPDVRGACCQILTAYGPRNQRFLELIERRIREDSSDEVREQWIVSLAVAWKKSEDLRRRLLTIAEQNDSGKARAVALHALSRSWPRARGICELLKRRLIADDSADAREAAIDELGSRWKTDSDVAPLLVSRAESDPANEVRMHALDELHRMRVTGPNLLPTVIELLKPGSAQYRNFAIQNAAAWYKDSPEMFSIISRLARLDHDPDVRRFAAIAVADLWAAHPDALKVLESVTCYGYPWPPEMADRVDRHSVAAYFAGMTRPLGKAYDDAFRLPGDTQQSPVDFIKPGSAENREAGHRLLQSLATYDLRWETRQRAVRQLAREWKNSVQVDAFLKACSQSDENEAVRWTATRELARRQAIATGFQFDTVIDENPIHLSSASLARKQYFTAASKRSHNAAELQQQYRNMLNIYTETEGSAVWAYLQIALGDNLMASPPEELERNAALAQQHYQAALRIYSESHTPWHWAQTCLRLQKLHRAMLANGGQQAAQHAASAIQYLQSCLRVWTMEWNPSEWASTQDDLGVRYVATDGADQQRAIACFQEALRVFTRRSLPQDYGIVQWNLGRAYQIQARGAPGDLTRAIESYEEASATIGDPLKWAVLQDWISECIRRIQTGDRARNIQRAIEQSERALTKFREQSHASDWASANELLGLAHLEAKVISGDGQLMAAIRCFEAALRVYTRASFPFRWAALQDGLGEAYRLLESGDRIENLHKSIQFSTSALEEFPRSLYPTDWAIVQDNLGQTQLARFEAGAADAAQSAIAHFAQALEVFASAEDAIHTGLAQANLGTAYRASGDLDEALSLQLTGLAAIDKSAYPQTYAETVFELALTYRYLVLRGEKAYEGPYRECLNLALQFYDLLRFPTRHRQMLSAAENRPIVKGK